MGKRLAIKGHSTRGKEVIELLEMMGGKNKSDNEGEYENLYYCIDDDGDINYMSELELDEEFTVFTLDEFYAKYPYKVGDKVDVWVKGADIEGYGTYEPVEIESIKWDDIRRKIVYKVKDINRWFWVEDIKCKYDNKETKVEGNLIVSEDVTKNERMEIDLNEYDYKVKNGKLIISKKKPVYPTTISECCKIIYDIPNYAHCGHKHELLFNFQNLLICRNAYWKIVGEQLGLDKHWAHDWDSGKPCYCISVSRNTIGKGKWYTDNKILAFPTEEIRDTFYENFKDLIENCKELL